MRRALIRQVLPLMLAASVLAGLPLYAQMPPGWFRQEELGAGRNGLWYGGGIWAGDKHGVPATFVDSLGLGNALTGEGTHLEAGWRNPAWDLAGQINAWHDTEGQTRIIIQRFHLAYTSPGGWRTALEQEPLVWGYGLNGGYVLGEAARPFPRFRVESPFRDLSVFGVPLGSWKAEIFLGQVVGHKAVGEASQDPSLRNHLIAPHPGDPPQPYPYQQAVSMGDPQQPFLSGLRIESRLGENTELYLNYINLFGGNALGQSMTRGYGAHDWLVSFLGLKDAISEGNQDFNGPPGSYNPASPGLAKSASSSDVGIRVRLSPFEQLLDANDVRFYVSRGAKAVNTRAQILFHRPYYAFNQDLTRDWKSFVHEPTYPVFDQRARYVLPTTPVPNDAIGLLARWDKLRIGIEYLDTTNTMLNPDSPGVTNHRTFESPIYLSGFYQEGDPLGNATGGEAQTFTLRVEMDWTPHWSTRTWVLCGDRPFRDVLVDWSLDHPGAIPVGNRFVEIQQVVDWHPDSVLKVSSGVSTQTQSAYLNVDGQRRTGFRWFIDLGWTWPRKP